MLRVVELAGASVAYGGRLLAELGHDVIRVESPEGDTLRQLGPNLTPEHDMENGAFHQYWNAGKRSFATDIQRDASGASAFLKLLMTSDALLAEAPLPIPEDRILAVNPSLAVVRVSDPLPELCVMARSGLLGLTGHPDGPPTLLGWHSAYTLTGCFAAMAVLSGVLGRGTGGDGQIIDLSVEDSLTGMSEQGVAALISTGDAFERTGYRGAITAISGAFRCADGYVMLSVPPQPDNWRKFMDWVGDPVLAEDASLADESERQARKAYIFERLEQWTLTLEAAELVPAAQRRGIPATQIVTPLELVQDPQLRARGYLQPMKNDVFSTPTYPVGALAAGRGHTPRQAPRLGEHNAEILDELTGLLGREP